MSSQFKSTVDETTSRRGSLMSSDRSKQIRPLEEAALKNFAGAIRIPTCGIFAQHQGARGAEESGAFGMDSKDHWRSRVMVDSLRGLSERQLTIVYMRIRLRKDVAQIASELHLPLEVVQREELVAHQHVKSYLRARGVSLDDVPDEDEVLTRARVQ
jgi:hypothetical protein